MPLIDTDLVKSHFIKTLFDRHLTMDDIKPALPLIEAMSKDLMTRVRQDILAIELEVRSRNALRGITNEPPVV